jgi:ABC-type transport system substrate-binding protein
MLIDREAFGTVVNGIDQYAKANVNVPYELDGHVPSFWKPSGYWIDPRDASKWGEGGKYWQHNVAEAKAMLSAAGFPNGLDVVLNQSNRAHGTPEQAQVIAQMLADGGVRPTINVVDYNSVFLPQLWVTGDVKGNFDGIVFGLGIAQAHIASTLYINTHSKGSFTTGRRWDDTQDKIDSMIDGALKELDENRLRSRVEETAKTLASYMSGFPITCSAPAPRLAWPWIQNYRVFWDSVTAFDQGTGAPSVPQFLFNWIDPELKTS